jgi:hypothetical protein
MAKKYEGRADFLFVYTQEAHPGPAFGSLAFKSTMPTMRATHSWEERRERALAFREAKAVGRRVLVDGDGEGSVHQRYARIRSNPLVVIGTDGLIALKLEWADMGPVARLLDGGGAEDTE